MIKEKIKIKKVSRYAQIGQITSHLSKISNYNWLFIWIPWWKHYVKDEYKGIISELEVTKGQETKAVFIIYEQQSQSTFPMLLSLLVCLVLQHRRSTGNSVSWQQVKHQRPPPPSSLESETRVALRWAHLNLIFH